MRKDQLNDTLAEANRLICGSVLEELKSIGASTLRSKLQETCISMPVRGRAYHPNPRPAQQETNVTQMSLPNQQRFSTMIGQVNQPSPGNIARPSIAPSSLPLQGLLVEQQSVASKEPIFYVGEEDEDLYGSGSLPCNIAGEGDQNIGPHVSSENTSIPGLSIPLTVDEYPPIIEPVLEETHRRDQVIKTPHCQTSENICNENLCSDADSLELPYNLPSIPENPVHKTHGHREYFFHPDMVNLKNKDLADIAVKCFSDLEEDSVGERNDTDQREPMHCVDVPNFEILLNSNSNVADVGRPSAFRIPVSPSVRRSGPPATAPVMEGFHHPARRFIRHSDSNISPYTVGLSNLAEKNERHKVLQLLKKIDFPLPGSPPKQAVAKHHFHQQNDHGHHKASKGQQSLHLAIRKPYEEPLPLRPLHQSQTAPILHQESHPMMSTDRRTSEHRLVYARQQSASPNDTEYRKSSGRNRSPQDARRPHSSAQSNTSEEEFQKLRIGKYLYRK